MIGNPFCTIKVFWNFHTKNRLAQVRHVTQKIDWRRCAMRFLINWRESGLHRSLKKRYSKIIKGQKKSLDRLWRYRPSGKAIHETRTEERRHE